MIKSVLFLPLFLAIGCVSNANVEQKEVQQDESFTTKVKARPCPDANVNNELFVYSDDPTQEPYYVNHKQDMSMQHIGNIEKVWDNYRGDGVTVAVIDNSGSYLHEEFWSGGQTHLSNKSANMYFNDDTDEVVIESVGNSFENASVIEPDPEGSGTNTPHHGVATSATVGAAVNEIGTTGIAPNCTILSIKIDLQSPTIDAAVRYAVNNGADVINMSFGANGANDEYVTYCQSYINYAYNHGVILVASAGNQNNDLPTTPAICDHVTGVGALAKHSSTIKASYSNYNESVTGGFNVDITAPGTVYTAKRVDDLGVSTYTEIQGTSFSGPIVAGAAALYKQKYGSAANQDSFERDLFASAIDIGDVGFDVYFGNGALDIYGLLNVGETPTYNDTTTKNQDSTDIYYEDQIGWLFRTVELTDLQYYRGYTAKDFENYLTNEIGARVATSSYQKEGTVASWACMTEDTPNNYFVNQGGTDSQRTLHLPWWVINGYVKFANNSNERFDSSTQYIASTTDHYKRQLKYYIYNNSGDAAISYVKGDATTYDFKAVTVTKNIYKEDASGNKSLLTTTTETSCVYDYYNVPSKSNQSNYISCGWYASNSYSAHYEKQILRDDTTIYELLLPANGMVYFQSQNFAKTMLYQCFSRDGIEFIEPLGPYPGTQMDVADGVTLMGNGLYRLPFYKYISTNVNDSFYIANENGPYINLMNVVDIYGIYLYQIGGSFSMVYSDPAEFVWNLNEARLNATNQSMCNISKSTAQTLLGTYNALDSVDKSVADTATFWTYKEDKSEGNEDVPLSSMLGLMQGIANSSGAKTFTIFGESSQNVDVFVILVATIFASAILFTILYRRKRKQNR